ncbi:hypothetical protein V8C86DRAFT_62036 [Haematococcus lacustris]
MALSAEMLKIIRGEQSEEEKHNAYDASLHRWWKEYASRKNDEEEEHVADSLLYDERCHLPRTVKCPAASGRVQGAPAAGVVLAQTGLNQSTPQPTRPPASGC